MSEAEIKKRADSMKNYLFNSVEGYANPHFEKIYNYTMKLYELIEKPKTNERQRPVPVTASE
ncbi:hypothetical protein [Flagellimonas eckloniae]|uniref:Uncharacterized protein n=1 Tax=Flagellimonas eckloniae TaxID=346185 RepID=A0A0N8WG11_9FLAO|nr:hypothetical protein [Allomuricauda eckloniae]KQC30203.1 hypothetical protein AAY42_10175 [Allomuricauda eckloniae]